MSRRSNRLLQEMAQQLVRLEHEAEMTRSILIVKEPNTGVVAEAYDGLRKQVVAAAAERRSHLVQLTAMAVAVARATSVDDLVPQVREWMLQAGVAETYDVPPGAHPQDVFEDVDGDGLAGARALEVIEPAYVDAGTGVVLRLGRARRSAAHAAPAAEEPSAVVVEPSASAEHESAGDDERATAGGLNAENRV